MSAVSSFFSKLDKARKTRHDTCIITYETEIELSWIAAAYLHYTPCHPHDGHNEKHSDPVSYVPVTFVALMSRDIINISIFSTNECTTLLGNKKSMYPN